MRIQHNIAAMNSYRNFSANNSNLNKNLEKLSTGYKINRAGDDAAGLAISEKMRAQITGLEGATKNSKDGISLIQTAEGALTEVHSMLNRMTTLAEQSANGTYQNELDREQLQKEVDALKSEIDRIADSTNFNGLKLLDGSLSDKFESVTTKPSAISNIQIDDYAAQSVSSAFSAKFIQNRPNQQAEVKASFEVSFDDITVTGGFANVNPVYDDSQKAEIASGSYKTDGTANEWKSGTYTAGKGDTKTKNQLTFSYYDTGKDNSNTKSVSLEFAADASLDDIVAAVNEKLKANNSLAQGDSPTSGLKATASNNQLVITGYGKTSAAGGSGDELKSASVTTLSFTAGTTESSTSNVQVKIGDATLNLEYAGGTTGIDGKQLAADLVKAGKDITVSAGATASTLDADYGAAAFDPTHQGDDNKYIKVDGHYYEMKYTANSNKVTFEQVDTIEEAGKSVKTDFPVSIAQTNTASGSGALNGTVNWFAQNTTEGNSGGSTHQAQAEVSVDFSKLKDGDKLTAGDKTYVFKIGTSSTTSADNNEVLVDLSTIMKESSDLTDESKQTLAMDEIVQTIGGKSAAWSAGNGGVADDVGTLTFQSLSGYDDDTKDIGDYNKNGKVNMTNEANVMKQFFATSAETAASVTFDFDASQIKVGDTFTLDGKTFEFTDGAEGTKASNYAINLHDLGVNGGLTSANNDAVMQLVKDAIETQGNGVSLKNNEPRYNVSINGSKMTLTSKEDPTTESIYEKRSAAKLELPTETKKGEGLVLQIGDTADTYNKLTVSIEDMHTSALGIGDLDISTQEGAAGALDKIKNAINSVSDTRGNMGALQNRLEHTINNLGVMRENIQNAESVIRDTDVAEEMMAYTKNNILNQSAQAMLAQANQLPQGVLQLLQ